MAVSQINKSDTITSQAKIDEQKQAQKKVESEKSATTSKQDSITLSEEAKRAQRAASEESAETRKKELE